MKAFVRIASGFCLLLLLATGLQATHYQGAEVSYSCISGCTYRITITEYFDCTGLIITPTNPTAALSFLPVNSCLPATPVPLGAWSLVSDTEVTPLAPSVIGSGTACTSPGGTFYGIRELTFSRDYDFCAVTCPIQLSIGSCCRNGAVTNLANPGTVGYEVNSTVWNPGVCNSAPQWLDPSYVIVDEGLNARISMAAYDADGDSLVYSLDSLFTDSGIPAIYNNGFSHLQPLGPNAIPVINSVTGDLSIPNYGNIVGQYAVGVSVREYRDGNLLGQYRRDLTVLAMVGSTHANDNPYLEPYGPPLMMPIGATYLDSFVVQGAVGSTLSLPIQALDPQAGDTITMTWSQNLPGATFTDLNSSAITDTIKGLNPIALFTWTPTQAGRYAFNVKLQDTTQYATGIADHSFLVVVDSCDLQADIGADTILICTGDSVLLSPSVSGGTPGYTYIWSTGDTSPSFWAYVQGTYTVWIEDTLGCMVTDTVTILEATNCVWPGDADDDGIADNNDLLALGLTYGFTGPIRPNATISWTGQTASSWTDTLPSGTNAVYSDTDGNGIVNDDDTLAINLNYGLTHNKSGGPEGGPGDPLLFLQPEVDSALVSDTLLIDIVLGVDTLPADSVYGIAFTVNYDPTLIEPMTAGVSYTGWMGNYGTNLLGLQKDSHLNGATAVALTRTDHQPISGFGTIATFSIVMIDDIAGKNTISETLNFSLSDIRLIRLDGSEVPVQKGDASVVVSESVSTSLYGALNMDLHIYPVPAHDAVFIETDQLQAWQVELFTLNGQILRRLTATRDRQVQLSLSGLTPGMYFLRIRTEQGQAVQKLEIRP